MLGSMSKEACAAENSLTLLWIDSVRCRSVTILIISNFRRILVCAFCSFYLLDKRMATINSLHFLLFTCSFVHCQVLVKLHTMMTYYESFWWRVRCGRWSLALLDFRVCRNWYLMMLFLHPLWRRFYLHWKM